MYDSRGYLKFVFIIITLCLLCLIADSIYATITDSKVIENRDNYEMYDTCYEIKGNYYCEKTK